MENQKIKERKNILFNEWIWCIVIFLLYKNLILGLLILLVLVGMIIYSKIYFRGDKFNEIKRNIAEYIDECNDLNKHIEELKSSYINVKKRDYGEAEYKNISKYKYKKKKFNVNFAPNIYDCSRQVCGNAQKQPFKYICKYFNISTDEETLEKLEEVLNNFLAAEEGKILLNNKKNSILASIKCDIPTIIRVLFAKDLDNNLGFEEILLNEFYFPQFIFRYISSGGNAGTQFTITMDIQMLERFIGYIDENIKMKKSATKQRRLMTPKLRNYIKERDNYTCMLCGNSTLKEENLLLEIDHIIPISKGGLTEENNLQTLCWKCNRSKGAKLV